jgi:hypothetical protein
MTRTSIIAAAALSAWCCGALAASAAPLRFVGATTGAVINIDIEHGSYPDTRVTLNGSQSFDFTIDPVASSIFFNKVEFETGPFTTVQSQNFLVPGSFTEMRTVTTTLFFDQFKLATTNVGPLALTSNLGTKFGIEEYRGDDRGGFTSATLTGHYQVVGPTQSFSSPFSATFPSGGGRVAFDPDNSTLDVGNLPLGAILDVSPREILMGFQHLHDYVDVFEGVVDGIPIDVRMLRIEVRAVAMAAVSAPEPSAGLLALIACMAFGRIRGRR